MLRFLFVHHLLLFVATAFSTMSDSESTKPRLEFWDQRWKDEKTGWHETQVHDALKRYGDILLPDSAPPARVLVPLCGKTVDLAYFASLDSVSQVVGIDGIPRALDTFALEQPQLNLEKRNDDDDSWVYYQSPSMELWCGDFFKLSPTEKFEAIFDRASMVAIDPTLRQDYVNVLDGVLTESGTILLVALERISGTEWDREGPPFSLLEKDIRQFYPESRWTVTVVEENGEQSANSDLDRPMVSKYYKVQRKSEGVASEEL